MKLKTDLFFKINITFITLDLSILLDLPTNKLIAATISGSDIAEFEDN